MLLLKYLLDIRVSYLPSFMPQRGSIEAMNKLHYRFRHNHLIRPDQIDFLFHGFFPPK